jgi:type II secretory pathway pseudopilin PulG
MGIVLAIATSSWFGVIESRRIDSATTQLAADLRQAHSRATNRLQTWQVALTANSSAYTVSATGSYTSAGVANTNLPDANGPRPVVKDSAGTDVARKCTFMPKPFPTTSPASSGCNISYPFPHLTPKADLLKSRAHAADTSTDRRYWDVSVDGSPNWTHLFPGGGDWRRLVFIDARGTTANYKPTGANKGALVVWCSRLKTYEKFQGIILNLKGDGHELWRA